MSEGEERDEGFETGASAPSSTTVLFEVSDATPEQVAALTLVLSSLGTQEQPTEPRSEWSAPTRLLRTTYASGPGAWRSSGLPR